jgi:hypothetical protein
MPEEPTLDRTSILDSTKTFCKLPAGYDVYDDELIMLINVELNTLNQAGVGVVGFQITDNTSKWNDFLGEDESKQSLAKQFIWQRVKVKFDPPANQFVQQAILDSTNEMIWRANVQAEGSFETEGEP